MKYLCRFSRLATACAAVLSLSHVSPLFAAEYSLDPSAQATIEALRDDPRVTDALERIVTLNAGSVDELIELTQIPAPPFQEARRAAHFAGLLRQAGLSEVWIDEVGNAIGRRPGRGDGRTVAYSAHLDTVFPLETELTVRREGERLYAPGIGDNTRGLITVLTVLRALEFAAIDTEADILFIGNVGEEGLGDLRGMKHLFRDGGPRIDTLIAVDGGETRRIVIGGVGSHRYRVTFSGPGGHSWGDFGMVNPHHAMGRAIALFDENALTVTREGEKTSYNVGRIGGGTSINSVPFESWMEVDMRSGSQAKLDEIDRVFQLSMATALLQENLARQRGPELTMAVERVGTRPAASGDASRQVVQHALAATLSFEISPELQISSTDANLPLSLGVPAITMSRGGIGDNAHSPDEWWQNLDGHIGIQIGLLTLLAEAGLAN